MSEKLNILIVDDIFTNRLLLSELIQRTGHNSQQVENGKEAIDLLQTNHFDLILMDIEMPVMNGIETTNYIRKKMPPPKNQIPVIALTAHNPEYFWDEYQDIDFTYLLLKPYSVEKITDLINKYCL